MVTGKKGQIDQLQGLIIPLVGIGIVLAIGFLILAEVKDQQHESEINCSAASHHNCSAGYNATATTITAIGDIPGWLPIIVITVIGVILIGLVSVFRRR